MGEEDFCCFDFVPNILLLQIVDVLVLHIFDDEVLELRVGVLGRRCRKSSLYKFW